MNFTREPIIETVITPREGCKLVVRSSKGANQEDHHVEAVEVVSFGHSFFYRSQERPSAFLVPVSDYEILELKETRMVLKSAASERSIKIGGGREAPVRQREPERDEPGGAFESRTAGSMEQGRKRDKRRRGGRRDRGHSESQDNTSLPEQSSEEETAFEGAEERLGESLAEPLPQQRVEGMEGQKAPSFISKLFPPPPTLIKETLSRYKQVPSSEGGDLFPPSSEEPVVFEERTSFEETIFDHPIPPDASSEEQENSEE